MKKPTKSVSIRSGGIAARLVPAEVGRDRHVEVETPRPRAQSPSASLETTPLAKPKFDRNAYQREYMRQWRAKRKK